MTARPAPAARRRFLRIFAGAAAGCAAWPAWARSTPRFEWRGVAMGAEAQIVLAHDDPARAQAAVTAARTEIERLERVFSLYRTDSALARLNRSGRLDQAPLEMCDLLERATWYAELSDGAFDVTVQPLWDAFARHFREHPRDHAGPSAKTVAAARKLVGYRRIAVAAGRITLAPGTRITLNGIAQGYVTDRVADLLRSRGWTNVLVDLGEIRALDGRPEGGPWRIARPGGNIVELVDGAVATSSGAAIPFAGSAFHHLFDPKTGSSAPGPGHPAVSVFAPRAVDADALSTALFVAAPADWARMLARVPNARVL